MKTIVIPKSTAMADAEGMRNLLRKHPRTREIPHRNAAIAAKFPSE